MHMYDLNFISLFRLSNILLYNYSLSIVHQMLLFMLLILNSYNLYPFFHLYLSVFMLYFHKYALHYPFHLYSILQTHIMLLLDYLLLLLYHILHLLVHYFLLFLHLMYMLLYNHLHSIALLLSLLLLYRFVLVSMNYNLLLRFIDPIC